MVLMNVLYTTFFSIGSNRGCLTRFARSPIPSHKYVTAVDKPINTPGFLGQLSTKRSIQFDLTLSLRESLARARLSNGYAESLEFSPALGLVCC